MQRQNTAYPSKIVIRGQRRFRINAQPFYGNLRDALRQHAKAAAMRSR